MTAELLNGISKDQSRFKQDPDFEKFWDAVQADTDRIREQYPDAAFDIPNEMPDIDGDEADSEGSGDDDSGPVADLKSKDQKSK